MNGNEGKKKLNITVKITIGLVLGIIVGFIMPAWLYKPVSLVANIYMSALRMMIYPLVFCSIVVGIIGIGDISKTGKIGLRSIVWYTVTTFVASALGLFLPRLLHLGEGITIKATDATVEAASFDGLLGTLESLIPSNPFTSFANGNMLQVLVFAVIIGFSCLGLGEKADPFVKLCHSVNDLSIFIVGKVMLFTPIGVFCCISTVVYSNGAATMKELAVVMISLYITYALYAILFYGGIVKIFGKYSPVMFFKKTAPAALNAFGTCSSSATLPISMECAREIGIPEEVSSLALPLGATINMDAVSIVMSFMITFFASACGVPLSIGTMVTILAANVLLSIGTPGVPGGAIAAFAALAPMAGLPLETILGVYISVNTLADMGATCVNVLGDLACSTAMKESFEK